MVLQRLPPSALAAVQPWAFRSESRGVANDSVNAMVDFDFEQLPACILNPRLPAVQPLPPLSSALGRADQVRGLPRAAAGGQVLARQPRMARAHPQHVGAGAPPLPAGLPGVQQDESAGRLAALEALAGLAALQAREHSDALQRAFPHTFLSPRSSTCSTAWPSAGRARASGSAAATTSPRTPQTCSTDCRRGSQPGRPLLAGQLLARSVPVRDGCSKSFEPPRLYPGQAYRLPSPARGRPPQPALPHRDAYRGTCLQRASPAPGSPSTPACAASGGLCTAVRPTRCCSRGRRCASRG